MMRMLAGLLLILAACSPATATPANEVQYGSDAVYQRIGSMSDCDDLQAEFDQASANHDRAEPGSDAARASTGYMEAADARMQEVGCY